MQGTQPPDQAMARNAQPNKGYDTLPTAQRQAALKAYASVSTHHPEAPRQLGLLDSTMINMGTMIGSGIFFVPAVIAQNLTQPEWILGAWVLGGLLSLCGALSMAELGAMMPHAGGQYHYLKRAYGPVWGYLYGWSTFAVINTAAISAVAIAFAQGLTFFMPLSDWDVKGVALASLLVLTAINWVGVQWGARVQTLLTSLKIAAMGVLILMCGWAALTGTLPVHPSHPSAPALPAGGWLAAFGLSMCSVLWAYDGWIQITYVAGEVKEPQKNIPKSLLYATLGVMALYALLNWGYLAVLSSPEMAQSTVVATDTAKALMGPTGGAFIAIAILLSTFGANNGFILTGARIHYAMAKGGAFFPSAGQLHPTWKTPTTALLFQGLWAALLILTGSFETLIAHVVFVSWIFYALSAGAVLLLRKREPQARRPYSTWGYPVTPLLFIVFALCLTFSTVVASPWGSLAGLGVILAGLPGYFYWKRQNRLDEKAEGLA